MNIKEIINEMAREIVKHEHTVDAIYHAELPNEQHWNELETECKRFYEWQESMLYPFASYPVDYDWVMDCVYDYEEVYSNRDLKYLLQYPEEEMYKRYFEYLRDHYHGLNLNPFEKKIWNLYGKDLEEMSEEDFLLLMTMDRSDLERICPACSWWEYLYSLEMSAYDKYEQWSDYDERFPDNPYQSGLIVNGHKYTTDYSGIAGAYWADNGGPWWME